MVSYETIFAVISDHVQKCSDYPKAIALKYFKEHRDEFITETYDEGINPKSDDSPVGHLQHQQAEAQERIEYTGRERGVLKGYSTNTFQPIQKYNNETDDWEESVLSKDGFYSDRFNAWMLPIFNFHKNEEGKEVCTLENVPITNHVSLISNSIEKTPALEQDTILYRYGRIPGDIQEGGHGKFKGFTGLSYNKYTAHTEIKSWASWMDKSHRYKLTVYAPKGTKGIVLNQHTGCRDYQSELLLDKNQNFIVLKRNDKNKTADILLF